MGKLQQVHSASKMTIFFPYFAFLLEKHDFSPFGSFNSNIEVLNKLIGFYIPLF